MGGEGPGAGRGRAGGWPPVNLKSNRNFARNSRFCKTSIEWPPVTSWPALKFSHPAYGCINIKPHNTHTLLIIKLTLT